MIKHPLCAMHINGKILLGRCYCEAQYVVDDDTCSCCPYCCGGDEDATEVRPASYFRREFYD